MFKRKYFIASLVLVMSALGVESTSKGYIGRSTHLLAKSLSTSEIDNTQSNKESDELLRKGSTLTHLGIGLAVLSFIFWLASVRQREPAWQSIPPVLLASYILLLLIMV